MKRVFHFIGVATLPIITSCSSVEECNSAEVQELLMTSVKHEMSLQLGKEQADNKAYLVKNIKHKGESDKPGREQHECFAELLISGGEDDAVDARPLSYSVIKNDKDEIRLKINRI